MLCSQIYAYCHLFYGSQCIYTPISATYNISDVQCLIFLCRVLDTLNQYFSTGNPEWWVFSLACVARWNSAITAKSEIQDVDDNNIAHFYTTIRWYIHRWFNILLSQQTASSSWFIYECYVSLPLISLVFFDTPECWWLSRIFSYWTQRGNNAHFTLTGYMTQHNQLSPSCEKYLPYKYDTNVIQLGTLLKKQRQQKWFKYCQRCGRLTDENALRMTD